MYVIVAQESINNFMDPDQLSDRLRNFQQKLENGFHTSFDQSSSKQTIEELVTEIVGQLEALLPSKALKYIRDC